MPVALKVKPLVLFVYVNDPLMPAFVRLTLKPKFASPPLTAIFPEPDHLSFTTVTVIAADVVLFPAASRATAVRVCDPSVAVTVFHAIEYGEVVSSAPTFTPSTLN